jgi:hypothetical protein
MRGIATIFVLIIFTVLLMTGCYYNIQADKDKQTASTITEKAVDKISINVPYKQVHYTKVSKDFVYEFSSNDEGLPVGIQDDYKKLLASEEIFARKFNLNFDSEIIEKLKECF